MARLPEDVATWGSGLVSRASRAKKGLRSLPRSLPSSEVYLKRLRLLTSPPTTSLVLFGGHELSRLRELERELQLRFEVLPKPSDSALRKASLRALAQELRQAAQQRLGIAR